MKDNRRKTSWAIPIWAFLAFALVGRGAQLAAQQAVQHAAQTAETQPAPDQPSGEESEANSHRLREGTRISNRVGHFRQNGESLTFVDEENREIGGLPNLNLERIIRLLKTVDEPESISWSVSGSITEFSGRNYILITRAVYKAAANQGRAAIQAPAE